MKKKDMKSLAIIVALLLLLSQVDYKQAISAYGGATKYYLGNANTPADTIHLTGSRSAAEIIKNIVSMSCPSAQHVITIKDVLGKTYVASPKAIGAITYNAYTNKFLFAGGASATAFSFDYTPVVAEYYVAYERIQCNGIDVTNVQQYNFRVLERPTTVTIVKNCGNIGQNQKTRSCYYKTCEIQANGNWDWSMEKQSPTFCDYVPPATTSTSTAAAPTQQPAPACTSVWVTGAWSDCIGGLITRQVTDNNNCANPTGTKPETQKACTNGIAIVETSAAQAPAQTPQVESAATTETTATTGSPAVADLNISMTEVKTTDISRPAMPATDTASTEPPQSAVPEWVYIIIGISALVIAWREFKGKKRK